MPVDDYIIHPAHLAGPGSVQEHIKMINKNFGGAAGSQWQGQEPYPLFTCLIAAGGGGASLLHV